MDRWEPTGSFYFYELDLSLLFFLRVGLFFEFPFCSHSLTRSLLLFEEAATTPCLVFVFVSKQRHRLTFENSSYRTYNLLSTLLDSFLCSSNISIKMRSSLSVACGIAFAALASAIPTISVKGSKFFTSDGNQYFVRGE